MTVPSEELELAAGFEPADREGWRALALGVLRKARRATDGTTPAEAERLLEVTTYDGVTISPLYTADDAAGLAPGVPGLPPFTRGNAREAAAEPAPDDASGAPTAASVGGWDVRQRHADPDPERTAAAVLADLENGGTSTWLVLGEGGLPVDGLHRALRDVYVELAPVVLDAGAQTAEAARAFLALVEERGIEAEARGNLGADPLGLAARTGTEPDLTALTGLAGRVAADFPGLRTATVDGTVYHDAGGSDAEELGISLAVGVAYLRALVDAGLSVEAALAQLEFRYAATADQFLTIAKFRAARTIWHRVAEVCGAAPEARGQRQHAVTSAAMMSGRDPWVNLLRATLACLGGGLGGAEAVTVAPFDMVLGLPDGFSRRLARNTQSLLLEESSLGRVVDPAGGSWYVEKLTADLAHASWEFFTEIEQAGGAAAAQGLIGERLAATWADRRANIAHRRDPLTGVSEFANPTEKLPERQPAPDRPGGGLPRVRYGQDFEALRDRADARADRPVVFLATLGSAAASTARASFAANLFQAGGFTTVTSGAGSDPEVIAAAFRDSGATVACLASADKVYAEAGEAVAAALTAAGATRVWLAGKPGTVSGVTDHLFAGCDAVEVLRTTLTDVGVA